MDRIERDARRLCRADGWVPDVIKPRTGQPRWHDYAFTAHQLHAAGFTTAEIEPDEAAIERAVAALNSWLDLDANTEDGIREAVGAAYRDIVEGGAE